MGTSPEICDGVGGIVGATDAEVNITGCVSLGNIMGATNVGKISGSAEGMPGILANNYAYDMLTVNGLPGTPGTTSDQNGENVTYGDITDMTASSLFAALGWDFINLWTWSAVPGVKLPILQGLDEILQHPSLEP